jgi:hypothetical protein
MRTFKNRHPYFTHATPHKLRHTGATTKTYVNASNVIPMAVGEIAYRNLKK